LAGDLDNKAANAGRMKFGIPPLQEARQELWLENAQAAEMFAAMSTQWYVSGRGAVIGFRYEAVPLVQDMLQIDAADRREVFNGLRVMELEAVTILNKKD